MAKGFKKASENLNEEVKLSPTANVDDITVMNSTTDKPASTPSALKFGKGFSSSEPRADVNDELAVVNEKLTADKTSEKPEVKSKSIASEVKPESGDTIAPKTPKKNSRNRLIPGITVAVAIGIIILAIVLILSHTNKNDISKNTDSHSYDNNQDIGNFIIEESKNMPDAPDIEGTYYPKVLEYWPQTHGYADYLLDIGNPTDDDKLHIKYYKKDGTVIYDEYVDYEPNGMFDHQSYVRIDTNGALGVIYITIYVKRNETVQVAAKRDGQYTGVATEYVRQ